MTTAYKKTTKEQRSEIQRLFKSDMTRKEIAEVMQLSNQCVSYWLKGKPKRFGEAKPKKKPSLPIPPMPKLPQAQTLDYMIERTKLRLEVLLEMKRESEK